MSEIVTTNVGIAAGQIVYDRHGHEAEYVGYLNGSHLVRPAVLRWSGDPEEGETTSYEGIAEWPEVFVKPPVEKLNVEVAALQKQIDELETRLIEARAKDHEVEREIKARMARITRHEKLALLDDFLAGKITHYVMEATYGEERLHVQEIKKTESQYTDRTDRGVDRLRLLCLFGWSKGDITWRINQYNDGSSSSWTTVHPCTSLEQAQQVAQKLYDEQLAKWRELHAKEGKQPEHWSHTTLIATAKHLGISVAEDLAAYAHEQDVIFHRRYVEKARKELAELEQALARVEAGEPVDPTKPVPPAAA